MTFAEIEAVARALTKHEADAPGAWERYVPASRAAIAALDACREAQK